MIEKKKDKKVYSSVLRYQCILDCYIFQDIFFFTVMYFFLIGITYRLIDSDFGSTNKYLPVGQSLGFRFGDKLW